MLGYVLDTLRSPDHHTTAPSAHHSDLTTGQVHIYRQAACSSPRKLECPRLVTQSFESGSRISVEKGREESLATCTKSIDVHARTSGSPVLLQPASAPEQPSFAPALSLPYSRLSTMSCKAIFAAVLAAVTVVRAAPTTFFGDGTSPRVHSLTLKQTHSSCCS